MIKIGTALFEATEELEREKGISKEVIIESLKDALVAAYKKHIKVKEAPNVEAILDEMIYNLVDNSIKYGKTHGTTDISLKKEDGHIIISVKDDGIGIEPGEQSRVFERFYRIDKSHSKKISGTGLGLSIVKHGAE